MKIATGPATLGFEETPTGSCTCPACRAPAAGPTRTGDRVHQLVRRTCVVTTVLAGAGVLGLTLGATTANAAPAPSSQGWDGSKYWFKNADGDWRWTSHRNVYQSHTSGTPAAAAAGGGINQGWDGSRYWFKNSGGQWRWTSHHDIYVSRTGAGPASAPTPAPTPTPAQGRTEAAVSYALAQVGKPYVWGGDGPNGFDCSGLVQQAYSRSGVGLPRVADDQYAATTPIGSGELRRGDLVFWSSSSRASGIHHVGIYLGGGKFVEAPRPGKTVRVSTLSSGYYPTHFGRP